MAALLRPEARPGILDFDRHTDAIKTKSRVILQQDEEPKANSEGKTILMRKGYIGVFAVSEVTLNNEGLRFKFGERLCHLK